jgi:hypothetical protein
MENRPLNKALGIAFAVACAVGVPSVIAKTMDIKLPYPAIWGVLAIAAPTAGAWVYADERKRSGRPVFAPPSPATSSLVEQAVQELGATALQQAQQALPQILRAADNAATQPQVEKIFADLPVVQVHAQVHPAPVSQPAVELNGAAPESFVLYGEQPENDDLSELPLISLNGRPEVEADVWGRE